MTRSNGAGEPHGNQPPPFLTKTYDMVDDTSTDDVISWAPDGKSFVVWQPPEFARDLLPRHFKHSNFSSFVRQLNTYGFRKIDPDRWQFANENFIKGRKDLLREIHRRKPVATSANNSNAPAAAATASNGPGTPSANAAAAVANGVLAPHTLVPAAVQPAVEVGMYGGFQQELEGLKRDKNVLMMELVRMRQAQSSSDAQISQLHERLNMMEQRQNSLISFFANALKDPRMLQRLLAQISTAGVQRIGPPAGRKKRRARAANDTVVESAGNTEQPDLELDMLDPDSPELDPFTGFPVGITEDDETTSALANGCPSLMAEPQQQLVQYRGPGSPHNAGDIFLQQLSHAITPGKDYQHSRDAQHGNDQRAIVPTSPLNLSRGPHGLPELMTGFNAAFDSLQLNGLAGQNNLGGGTNMAMANGFHTTPFAADDIMGHHDTLGPVRNYHPAPTVTIASSTSISADNGNDNSSKQAGMQTQTSRHMLIPATTAVMGPPTTGMGFTEGISNLPMLNTSAMSQQRIPTPGPNTSAMSVNASTSAAISSSQQQQQQQQPPQQQPVDNPAMYLNPQEHEMDHSLINLDHMTSSELLLNDDLFRNEDLWHMLASPAGSLGPQPPAVSAQDAAQVSAAEDLITRLIKEESMV